MNENNWGGARPGAGRRALAPEDRRVGLCSSIPASVKRMADELRGNGCNLNAVIEDAIRTQYAEIFAD